MCDWIKKYYGALMLFFMLLELILLIKIAFLPAP